VASPFALLFVILLAAYAYTPPRWQDWNQNSRFNLTQAIVERGTVRIDAYVANTGDYALVDGHAYTDKAPGLSLSAVPVYTVTRALQPFGLSWVSDRLSNSPSFSATLNPDGSGTTRERVDIAVALTLATVICVAFPAALMGVLLARMVAHLTGCRTAGILSALIIGLATPVFTYSQAFYGHVPAAACIVGALALLVLRPPREIGTWRLIGVGALLGWALVIEYPAAIAALPVAAYVVWLARGRAIVYGGVGAIPPLAVLIAYDLIAFGTPLPVGYAHSALWQEQHDTGFMSLSSPTWDAIWGLSGSPFRGLFFFAPVLLLVVPGLWLALRDPRQRSVALVVLAAFAGMFLFAASSVMWWGGFAVGPRYIVPALPLLALPLGSLIARLNQMALRPRAAGLGIVVLLAGLSAGLTWATTLAGQSYPPDTIRHPLVDYVLPAWRDGDIARNLGMALQLSGLASLLPLLLLLGIGLGLIGLRLRPVVEARA
jgi:hypothetical protein